MIQVFYKGKIIFFSSSVEGFSSSESIFYNGDIMLLNIDYLMFKLECVDRIAIISEDITDCYNQFSKQFKAINAAGGVVHNRNGEVLMIFRNNRWDLPKGKQEDGESIEVCAVREVMEECGIEGLERGELINKSVHIYNLYGGWHLKQTWWYYMFCDYTKELIPQEEEGITEVKWITKSDIPNLLKNSYSTIIDVMGKAEKFITNK